MKKILVALIIVSILSGCADSVSITTNLEPVGFLHGFWHGMILLFSWVISLFIDDVAIYAVYNNGGWYDFGFFLGVGTLTGSSAAAK